MAAGISRATRFIASLVPAILVLVSALAVISFVAARIGGGLGLFLGIVSGASLALGVTLAYWVMVDWVNLRIIRQSLAAGPTLPDGAVIAFEGIVRVDGEPMRAPFSTARAAAYTYVVSHSRHSATGGRRRQVFLQGFHMMRTRVEGSSLSLRLRTFPGLEDGLRENQGGVTWGKHALALDEALAGRAGSAGQRERESRLLETRHTEVDEVHQDYRVLAVREPTVGFVIEEEVLPADTRVCVIATYDRASGSLTGTKARIGPNVMIYRGSAEEVLARVGGETGGFVKAIIALLTVALVPLVVALAL